MGNASSSSIDLKHLPKPMKGNAALFDFIEDECPILNKAVLSNDENFQNAVIHEFNKVLRNQQFNSIEDIMHYMESQRMDRMQLLKSISDEKFSKTPKAKFPCIAIRINGKIAMSFMDTGCEASTLTYKFATKLGLQDNIIENVKGLANGFGNHQKLIGMLSHVPVQIGEMLFHVNFLVIEKSPVDFIIFGADFIVNEKLKLNFKNGDVVFPRQSVRENTVRFIPTLEDNIDTSENIVRMIENMNGPRTFGSLPKLINQRNVFINVRINDLPVQAMIDSGSETSMITSKIATYLKVFKFCDIRQQRIMHGLGPIVIIGRIPPIPVEFDERTTIFMPFDVRSESEHKFIILGTDFLTYYGCEIDLTTHQLHISLDRKRSYKLCEKQLYDSSITNIDSKEYGIVSPLRSKTIEEGEEEITLSI